MSQQEKKEAAIAILRRRFAEQRERLREIDPRLEAYFAGLCEHTSAVENDPDDWHNLYEILGGVKFLRMLRTYDFNLRKVRKVLEMREGVWRQDASGVWRYVSGGLKCPGSTGATVYRWKPFQVFIIASVFGFRAWFDTHLTLADRDQLLPTEKVDERGHILDLRRVVTDYTCFMPRKTDKTGLSAYIQLVFFLIEDYNAEVYCCANSAEQAKILYRRTKLLIAQIDDGRRIRQTETVCDWRPAYKSVRDSSIRPLSAGGKTKDGMFAQLCSIDEYGSAAFANGRSDMKMLVDVVQSSMGPRREPLTFITTTAGRVQTGPFMMKLDGLHHLLEQELEWDDGEPPSVGSDRTMGFCLEPDEWERDEDTLTTSLTVRRKVNPMLGSIVQHQFYDDEIEKGRRDGDLDEVMTKLFNVYQSGRQEKWLTPDEIRSIQTDMRIDDCRDSDGWMVFCGLDFSKGDDLNGVSYLAVNSETGEFFGDMDSYISQEAVDRSPLRELYLSWANDDWLHIVPGKTFDPSWPVNRIIELHNQGVNFVSFGYDPYNAKIVMNALSSWVVSLGLDPRQIIVPVRQNFATYNPAVNEFDYMVKRCAQYDDGKTEPAPMIHLSRNPMWPWQFGNTVLGVSSDGMENRKPVKGGQPSAKVDNVQMLLSALLCYDMMEGEVYT